MMQETDFEGSN